MKTLLKIVLGLASLGVMGLLTIALMGGLYEKVLILLDRYRQSKPTGAGEA